MKPIAAWIDSLQSVTSRLFKPGIYYVAPDANWIIDWVGYFITKEIREQFGHTARVIQKPDRLSRQLIHHGSLWSWLGYLDSKVNSRNVIIATVFHGNREEENFRDPIDKLVEHQDEIKTLVTASSMMVNRFLRWGIAAERIVKIPLGVPLDIFHAGTSAERYAKRAEFGIAEDAFCIGSFQKDGVGWEDGFEPKMIKGPDIFVQVVERLSRHTKIHVLLSGPARGYVKRRLDKLGVTYSHRLLENYFDIAPCYHALDAYLVTSREEGGPSGVLEAMASGIPLVATRVGLAADVAREGVDAAICPIEDVDALANAVSKIQNDPVTSKKMVSSALERVMNYSWEKIAGRYYQEVYKPILEKFS